MGAGVIGFILGLIAGAATGSELGAFTGAAFGLVIGLTIHAIGWMRAHLGDAPIVERHNVMCTPFGQLAQVHARGDVDTGRWYDVKRCSLLQDPTNVECDKGCVRMLNASRTRPGRACSCGE